MASPLLPTPESQELEAEGPQERGGPLVVVTTGVRRLCPAPARLPQSPGRRPERRPRVLDEAMRTPTSQVGRGLSAMISVNFLAPAALNARSGVGWGGGGGSTRAAE